MWDLTVLVPHYCLYFYSDLAGSFLLFQLTPSSTITVGRDFVTPVRTIFIAITQPTCRDTIPSMYTREITSAACKS